MNTHRLPHVWPTVVHMLADAAKHSPDHAALICGAEELSYRQYAACVSGLAGELRTQGADNGDRVVLLMANSIDIAIATFAVQAAGAQVVPLNPWYTASELGQVLERADARGILYDEACSATVASFESRFAFAWCIGNGSGTQRLLRWREAPALADELPLPRPDQPSTLQFTGGTTGVPKGVDLSHRAVSTNVSQREALLPTRREAETILAVTPLFHVYAVSMGLYLSAYCRGTLVIMPRYRPDAVLAEIRDRRISILLGSPTIFTGLMAFEGFERARLDSLRWCSSGSAALGEETLRRWESATGCTICEGYGQTEAGPVVSYNPLEGPRKIGTVGVAVPETEIEIRDVETGSKALSVGEEGEVCVKGPQIMSGYYGMPKETAEALRDGWLYTGDIGRLDDEGYLSICDRKKDMVIVSGYNVYPREIEEALHRHAGVREAAVIGVPDSYRGEVLAAYVIAEEGTTVAELTDYLSRNLVKYKWPASLEIVSELPRTGAGKLDKKALRKQRIARG